MRNSISNPERQQTKVRVVREEDAHEIVHAALDALAALEPIVEEETKLLRAGKMRPALDLMMEKNKAAQLYTHCLDNIRHNAVAIGRFRPEKLDMLQNRHQEFTSKLASNLSAIATARSVSEELLRGVADAVGQNASPKTYHKGKTHRKAGTTPLTLSKSI